MTLRDDVPMINPLVRLIWDQQLPNISVQDALKIVQREIDNACRMPTLRGQNNTLRKLLLRYGGHVDGCNPGRGAKCQCGWRQIVRELT